MAITKIVSQKPLHLCRALSFNSAFCNPARNILEVNNVKSSPPNLIFVNYTISDVYFMSYNNLDFTIYQVFFNLFWNLVDLFLQFLAAVVSRHVKVEDWEWGHHVFLNNKGTLTYVITQMMRSTNKALHFWSDVHEYVILYLLTHVITVISTINTCQKFFHQRNRSYVDIWIQKVRPSKPEEVTLG